MYPTYCMIFGKKKIAVLNAVSKLVNMIPNVLKNPCIEIFLVATPLLQYHCINLFLRVDAL